MSGWRNKSRQNLPKSGDEGFGLIRHGAQFLDQPPPPFVIRHRLVSVCLFPHLLRL